MSLDRLIEQIRSRSEAELGEILQRRDAEEARVAAERDRTIATVRTESARATENEIARERAQRLAGAKLNARKRVYEARERRLREALQTTSSLLAEYTESDEYLETLRRMTAAAGQALGKQVRISGRAADATRLSKIAGKTFDPTPRPILGGVVAETVDGTRQLNLSFDELLRLRENRVREILS